MFQPAYTMLGHNWVDERGAEGLGYIRAVGTLFPKQLVQVMPEMQDIVQVAFRDFAGAKMVRETKPTSPASLPVYKMSKTILCKLNGFCFFGPELGVFVSPYFRGDLKSDQDTSTRRVLHGNDI